VTRQKEATTYSNPQVRFLPTLALLAETRPAFAPRPRVLERNYC
jgi:hypothetical protein